MTDLIENDTRHFDEILRNANAREQSKIDPLITSRAYKSLQGPIIRLHGIYLPCSYHNKNQLKYLYVLTIRSLS